MKRLLLALAATAAFVAPTHAAPPFVALLVSGGHIQLVAVEAIGRYRVLGFASAAVVASSP